jgi:primase-polymerase (primpol)-like protein
MIYHNRENTGTDGVAVMLGGSLTVVAINECRDPDLGEIDEWAMEIVEAVDTYTEVSRHGTGLRLFATHDPSEPLRTNLDLPREAEDSIQNRVDLRTTGHVVYTGQQLPGTPNGVRLRSTEVRALYETCV